MPLKTNIGISRKVADNNYGSRGASVNLEVELDSSLIQEPERLQERVRQVFRMAQQSVDEELARQNTTSGQDNNPSAATGNGNGPHNCNGNGHAAPRRSNGRRATASQARALRAIADRQGLDLVTELQGRFGVQKPEELSISEASQTIDDLLASANGNGRR